jgi:hypothetical protein
VPDLSMLRRAGGEALLGTVGGSMKLGAARRGNFGGGLQRRQNVTTSVKVYVSIFHFMAQSQSCVCM